MKSYELLLGWQAVTGPLQSTPQDPHPCTVAVQYVPQHTTLDPSSCNSHNNDCSATLLLHCSLFSVFCPRTAAVHFNFPACVNNLNNSMSSPTGIRQKQVRGGRGSARLLFVTSTPGQTWPITCGCRVSICLAFFVPSCFFFLLFRLLTKYFR